MSRNFFTADEKAALVCLVKKHRAVSSKETGPRALLEKKAAWVKLVEDFNMLPGNSKRTQAQLKKLWENEKMRRKKELGKEKRDIMLTGGGRFISTAPLHDAVDDVLNDAADIELHQVMDCDAIQQEELPACSEVTYCSEASQAAPDLQVSAPLCLTQPDSVTQLEVEWEMAESPHMVTPIREPEENELEDLLIEDTERPTQIVTPLRSTAARRRALMLPTLASLRSRLKGSTTRDAAILEEAEQRFLRNQFLMAQDKKIFQVRLETEIEKREAAKERRIADGIVAQNDIRSSELRRKLLERELGEEK